MKDDLQKTNEELSAELQKLRLKSNQQEARLNEMQNLSKIGYWDLDLRTNELFWSDEIFRIFDLDPQHFEATYEAFLDNIHPDDREFVNNAYTNSVKNKEPYNIVHRVLLKNGTLKFVNERCETLYDDAGIAIRSIGTVRDITKSKLTEDALQESENNLRALFNAMEDVVFEIDNNGRIIHIAPTSAKQMYVPPQNALGKTVHEIFPKKEADMFFDFIKTSIIEQKTKILQYPLVINNETIWFEGKATPKTNTTVLFIARNINESKLKEEKLKAALQQLKASNQQLQAAEQQLQAANQQLKANNQQLVATEKELRKEKVFSERIVETSNAIIIGLDKKHIIKLFNRGAEQITGYKKEEVLGKDWFKLFLSKKELDEMKKVWGDMWSGDVYPYINPIQTKSNEERIISWQNTGLSIDVDHSKTLMISIGEDITERKRAEEELSQSEKRYSLMLDTTLEGYILADSEGQIIQVNPSYCKMVGYNERELLSMNIRKIEAKLNKHEVTKRIQQMIEEGRARFETRHRAKNGQLIDLDVSTSIIQYDKNAPLVAAFVRDITQQKQAEEALKESELKFQKIIDESFAGISVTNEEGKIIVWNNALEKITGIKNTQTIDRYIWDVQADLLDRETTGTKRKEEIKSSLLIVLKTGKAPWLSKAMERDYIHPDGSVKTVSGRMYTIKTQRGYLVVSVSNDITERKRAEETLKEAQSNLQALLDNRKDSIWALDRNYNYLVYNKPYADVIYNEMGIRLEKGLNALEIHPKEVNDFWKPKFDEALNGNYVTFEFSHVLEGKEHYFEVYLNPIYTEGKITGLSALSMNITERKNTENKLIEDEKRLKLLNRLMSEMMLLKDKKSIYNFISNTLHSHCPNSFVITVSIDESAQLTKLETVSGLDNSLMKKIIDITGFSPIGKEYKMTSGHKELFKSGGLQEINDGLAEFSGSAFPSFAAKSIEKLLGIHKIYSIGINKDDDLLAAVHFLTFKKQEIVDKNFYEVFVKEAGLILQKQLNERDLKNAKEKAEESDRLKSAFLANMSHEIRTPMNGILGFTGLLKEPHLSGEEMNQYIRIIEKSGLRMLNTINDIIDISKIESGQIEVVKTNVSINTILEEQYNFFYPEVKSKGLKLNAILSLPEKEQHIITDQQKLVGILTNLIKNAIKYTHEGSISFGCTLKRGKANKTLEFFVKDTGIGIPLNRIEAVFNRFEQADIEDSRAYEGSGLGLAISKSYVEMLGGSIHVESIEDEGSTFKFSIPYIKQKTIETKTEGQPGKRTQVSKHNLSVIVAEDDVISTQFFENVFKRTFKKIVFTSSGDETVRLCRENPDTDIILMDIKMPGMNGYEATQMIRKFNKDVIIIAQTAFGLTGEREKAMQAGCNEYISKPIHINELFEKIEVCLDKKGM